jgi:hypothetical protein
MRHHLPSWPYALVLVVFFGTVIGFAAWMLFQASGYRILQSPFRLVKTGLISLTVHPSEELVVTLNNEPVPVNHMTFSNLTPGRYVIKVTRPGFLPWEVTTSIAAGEAKSYPDILLFYEEPRHTPIPDDEAKIFRDLLDHPERFQSGLQIQGSELWADDALVTRYSGLITTALWLPTKTHLLVLVDGLLHSIEVNGSHDTVLFSVPAGETIRFAPTAGGQKLVVESASGLETIDITTPFDRNPLPSF